MTNISGQWGIKRVVKVVRVVKDVNKVRNVLAYIKFSSRMKKVCFLLLHFLKV